MLEVTAINEIKNTSYSYVSLETSNDKINQENISHKKDKKNEEIQDTVKLSIYKDKDKKHVEVSLNNLEEVAEKINNYIKENKRHLSFNVDSDKGIVSIEVINDETGKIIRKIPPEVWNKITRENTYQVVANIVSSL